jgi:predicted O-linked N-acetylglucosamine transferase (SPINDLY family)
MTVPQAFELALQRHRAGRLAEAESLFRQILAAQPDHAEARQSLGIIAHQVGRHDLAVDLLRQAIAFDPHNPFAHSNLGEAFRALGRIEEAIAAFRRALELKPDFPEAHHNLGLALRAQGLLDEPIASYRRALELRPNYPEAHNNLGIALSARGQLEAALAAFRRALELSPDDPQAWNNMGATLGARGQLEEAAAAHRRALELRPDYAQAHNNLGIALAGQGQFDEAIAAFRRALELQPGSSEALLNLGNALCECGGFDEAIAAYRRALELRPDFPEAHGNLGNALRNQGQLDEAVAECHRALAFKPDSPDALNNLGNALKAQGRLEEAVAAFRRALEVTPDDPGIHSNLVFTLHCQTGQETGSIAEECRRWNRQFSEPLKGLVRSHANDRSPDRRLRVGYVSPDFRDHPVGRFALPLFERHDRDRFDILCYSGVTRPDWMTERLRALAGEWRSTYGVPDARLAEMIRADQVDILVDLAMHTADDRLPVFAREPAPVQVTWLAYPGSAGLPSIGYRLTDASLDPPGSRGHGAAWSPDEPVRLPDCWCCYQPADESPEINALPAWSAGSVTFGSLNSFAKVNEGVLALWARVLDAVKGSRLLMFCPEGSARERVLAFFDARRIGRERVECVGFRPRREYLSLYHRIDLALDPFPYNGMTITCDALWMGTPVLSLPGAMPVSRAGLSILSTIGLGEMAASSEDAYVRIAVEWAANLPRLADLRATMRHRMRASPLMDAPRFARNVEAAYRSMWARWRDKGKG